MPLQFIHSTIFLTIDVQFFYARFFTSTFVVNVDVLRTIVHATEKKGDNRGRRVINVFVVIAD